MQKKYNAIIIAALVLIVLVILVAIFIYPVETEKEIETKEEVKQCKYYINKDIAISGDWDTSTHLINGEYGINKVVEVYDNEDHLCPEELNPKIINCLEEYMASKIFSGGVYNFHLVRNESIIFSGDWSTIISCEEKCYSHFQEENIKEGFYELGQRPEYNQREIKKCWGTTDGAGRYS